MAVVLAAFLGTASTLSSLSSSHSGCRPVRRRLGEALTVEAVEYTEANPDAVVAGDGFEDRLVVVVVVFDARVDTLDAWVDRDESNDGRVIVVVVAK